MFEENAELVERVRKENQEFDRLYVEHQKLESELGEFARLKHLNPQEELEKKRLQKIKLAGKDRMADILREYKQQNPI